MHCGYCFFEFLTETYNALPCSRHQSNVNSKKQLIFNVFYYLPYAGPLLQQKKWLVLKDVVQIYVYALNPDLDCK